MKLRRSLILLAAMAAIGLAASAGYALNVDDFVYVPPGTFVMGNDDSEKMDEKPEHTVTLTSGFLMYRHEITQKEWTDVMGTTPWLDDNQEPVSSHILIGDNYPAVMVSWTMAQEFIALLNSNENLNIYALPTEAQWEYACRAGTDTDFFFGDYNDSHPDMETILNTYLWYHIFGTPSAEENIHLVEQKLPNPFGLYDMHGNVWEWCYGGLRTYTDAAQTNPIGPTNDTCKTIRGGAFDTFAFQDYGFDCTSDERTCKRDETQDYSIGFRVTRALSAELDTDNDGITDNLDNCPLTPNADQIDSYPDNMGDACDPDDDNDGVVDADDDFPLDPQVATPRTADGTGKIKVDVSFNDGAYLSKVRTMPEDDFSLNPADKPEGVRFPYGMVGFEVNGIDPGATATVNLTFPGSVSPSAEYHKVDANGFFRFDGISVDGSTITLTLADTGDRAAGDGDGIADNGKISDPGGYGIGLGDINGDGTIDLADAVLALRILGGLSTPAPDMAEDPDGDSVIGLDDAIFLLQKLSRAR